MRKRVFEIIEVANENDSISSLYDGFMLVTIIISIVPLCFKSQSAGFLYIDRITAMIFILDYFLRWMTADLKLKKYKSRAFLMYPFTPMAIIDLFSILPSITILNPGFRLLKLFRLVRTFRIFKFIRYSKSIRVILNVLKKEKDVLLAVGYLALGYIVVAGLIMFQVEPDSFDSLFDAIYWSTTALTTVGYGDIYPVTVFGKLVSMISSIVGIAVVALPAGVITGGYIDEIKKSRED
ncbi:MAG: ion transporter [Roseburia sp.]|uniref:ion transporter n=1 Tax=Roseburia sp. 831b TaxID=1261635 RepID=UPI0009535213|nr:ion transporter [Roseburia sp. 831b]MCI5918858.1 ion transporter [Roseburia sp.]MDD6216966.1 ion transporter [Roseburia sp.]MDY5882573.1 ion transporter [Roseburia sp.]WVK72173.1 ion transporter [Roseburia sp. 831b]